MSDLIDLFHVRNQSNVIVKANFKPLYFLCDWRVVC